MDANAKSHYSKKLSEFYQEDTDTNLLEDEVKHLIHFIENDEVCALRSPADLYRLARDGLQAAFPTVETILNILLTIPVTNAGGEYSFSVLKQVKNYLQNTMSQEHLTSSAILTVESSSLQNITYDDLIDHFLKKKCRKKAI
ncbi:unnamed protein product [Eretmochelys imbricata]